MAPTYFHFESDFVDSLRCVPMQVRLKLDVSGVKLKLNEWSKLGKDDRALLAEMSCETPAQILDYHNFLSALVRKTSGAPPSLMTPPERIWEADQIPDQVAEKAVAAGFSLASEAWKKLTPLQRFALIKLSRPGHEGANFVPALEEFGIKK